jgi:hypothetical protein
MDQPASCASPPGADQDDNVARYALALDHQRARHKAFGLASSARIITPPTAATRPSNSRNRRANPSRWLLCRG